jgi:hypothetical protein
MSSTIPGPARDLVRTVTQAVDAASSGVDAATYEGAIAELTSQPIAGRVLGDLLRSLLEDTHPEGLDSDDITLVIGRCYRSAAAWLPPERVDVTMLLTALAGALGIHQPAVEPPAWPEYAWHAPLLVADLLPFGPVTLGSYLEAAFAEYAREAREELP